MIIKGIFLPLAIEESFIPIFMRFSCAVKLRTGSEIQCFVRSMLVLLYRQTITTRGNLSLNFLVG